MLLVVCGVNMLTPGRSAAFLFWGPKPEETVADVRLFKFVFDCWFMFVDLMAAGCEGARLVRDLIAASQADLPASSSLFESADRTRATGFGYPTPTY